MENTPSDTGSIKVDNCPRSKPLNFKLDRHSFPKVKSNYNFVSSTVSEMKNSRYSDSPNSETVYSIGKKRKYSLGSHLLPRSVRFNAIVKRKKQRSSSSYSPVRQLLNYQAVSLTSSNVERILSIDFLDTSFNSTVDSEFSPNDSTVPSEVSGTSAFSELSANDTTVPSDCSTYEWDAAANDRSGFISSQISSKCNSTVDSTNCESFGDQEIEDTFNYNSVKEDVVPIFGGYQLIGDSQLLRFSQKILGLQRDFTLSSSGSLGLCVSGQTISDLHRRVLEKFHPVGEQAILLIGTNDLLRGTQSSGMCRGLKYLLQDLLQSAKKIIILTLPPVPLLSHNEDHWTRMNSYNEYIKSLPCKENFYGKLTVADISPLFYKSSTRLCRYSCFERWFYGGRRKDLIHINEEGFNIIKHFLLTNAL